VRLRGTSRHIAPWQRLHRSASRLLQHHSGCPAHAGERHRQMAARWPGGRELTACNATQRRATPERSGDRSRSGDRAAVRHQGPGRSRGKPRHHPAGARHGERRTGATSGAGDRGHADEGNQPADRPSRGQQHSGPRNPAQTPLAGDIRGRLRTPFLSNARKEVLLVVDPVDLTRRAPQQRHSASGERCTRAAGTQSGKPSGSRPLARG
jgi:hypothetical protein